MNGLATHTRRRVRSNPEFADRFKPRKLSDLIGGEFIQRYFSIQGDRGDYDRDKILITGPSGSGKTSAAKIIAMAFAQGSQDLIRIINAGQLVTQETEAGRQSAPANPIPVFIELFESKTIAEAGEGEERAALAPGAFRFDQRTPQLQPGISDIAWHVGIIDQVERLDASEQGDLQNLLDVMPARTMMICTTVFPGQLEEQLRNRFKEFTLANPTEKQLTTFIRAVADSQKPPWPITAGEAKAIARDSRVGGFRVALTKLELAMVTGQLRSGTVPITQDPGVGASMLAIQRLEAAEEGEALQAAQASARALPAISLIQEPPPTVSPFPAGPGRRLGAKPSKFDFRDKKFGQAVKRSKPFKTAKSGTERNTVLDAQISIVEALVESGILSTAGDFTKAANRLARGAGDFSKEKRQATILRLAARRLKGTAKNPARRRPVFSSSRAKPTAARKAMVQRAQKFVQRGTRKRTLIISRKKALALKPGALQKAPMRETELFRPIDPKTMQPFGRFIEDTEAVLLGLEMFGAPVLVQSSLDEDVFDNKAARPHAWKRQAVFFKKSKFTPATARAWLKTQKLKVPKGKRLERITFKKGGAFFGWALRKLPPKAQRNRLRWVPFGKDIRVRFIAPGAKAPATANRTSLMHRSRTIQKPFHNGNGAVKNLSVKDLVRIFKRQAIKFRKSFRKIKAKPQFVLTVKPFTLADAGEPIDIAGGRFRTPGKRKRTAVGEFLAPGLVIGRTDPVRWAVVNLNATSSDALLQKNVMSEFFEFEEDAVAQLKKVAAGLEKAGLTVAIVDLLALPKINPAVVVRKVRGGYALVDRGTGKRIPGFDPYPTKAGAQMHVKTVQAELNPRGPSLASRNRRAEFLHNGEHPLDLAVGTIRINDTQIPLNDLVLIGNYRQINYSAPKFRGRKWIEYRHRPIGFPRQATKLMDPDGGLVFMHPKGAYMLVVPGKYQNGRFKFDGSGLTN